MQTDNSIKSGLAYIEQNLKTNITADELANMAGYSVWHYCRVFAHATGMTVAYYICKRRVDSALFEIANGRRAIDVVPEYGFDTYAGFYKAFVRMYGCSPKKHLALYRKNLLQKFGGLNMTTENKLREILNNWDIPQDLPLRDKYIFDGTEPSGNEWFLGDSYILRNWERDRLMKSFRVEKALAAQGFGSAAPVVTKSGMDYMDGELLYALTRKTSGEQLGKDDRFGENRRDFGFKYGASLARLHCALKTVESDIMPDEVDLYGQIIEWAMPEVKKQNTQLGMGLMDDFFEDYTKTFGAIVDKLPTQLIHRNPNPTCILFNNGEVSGFIDFDISERNVRLWDPCYCATGLLCEWRNVDNIYGKWPDILDGILQGYDSVNPLTTEEKQAVFYVICSIQMVVIAWLETQEGDEFRELAKTNREMLSYIVKHKEQITKIFRRGNPHAPQP